jgi:hypothetical protein
MDTETIRDAEVISKEVPPTYEEKKSYSYRPFIAFVLGVLVSVGGFRLYDIFTTPVAAIVNGTRITMEMFEKDVAMMEKGAALSGVDVNDPLVKKDIRTQALNNLITNELLIGAARESGAVTDDASIQTAYEELTTDVGGEEALNTRMEAVGLTRETLMDNIKDRLLVDSYLEGATDIETATVTDEEIQAYVAQMTGAGLAMPPSIDEIRPQLEATLLGEKQQQIVLDHIEKLRSEATIEIKVEDAVTATEAEQSETEGSDTQTIDGK